MGGGGGGGGAGIDKVYRLLNYFLDFRIKDGSIMKA